MINVSEMVEFVWRKLIIATAVLLHFDCFISGLTKSGKCITYGSWGNL